MNQSMFDVKRMTFPDTFKTRILMKCEANVFKAHNCTKCSYTIVTTVLPAPRLLWRSAFIVLG